MGNRRRAQGLDLPLSELLPIHDYRFRCTFLMLLHQIYYYIYYFFVHFNYIFTLALSAFRTFETQSVGTWRGTEIRTKGRRGTSRSVLEIKQKSRN